MRYALLLLLASFAAVAVAQNQPPAEIERRPPTVLPNAPQPTSSQAQADADQQWAQLIRGTRYTRPEVRIQAVGNPIRCDVDKVTTEEIFCTEHRANSGPLTNLFLPKEEYRVPRREILEVRTGGRGQATALGAAIGIGLGVGLGSVNRTTREDGGQAIFALLLGGLGALIGHAYSFAGHPVYQHP